MSCRIRIAPAVHTQITSWRLSDYLLVEIYLYLEEAAARHEGLNPLMQGASRRRLDECAVGTGIMPSA